MKYLVNRETKEHRLYTEGDYNRLGHVHGKWDVVEADDEGWIPWDGGECPLPGWCECEIQTKEGDRLLSREAKRWTWSQNIGDATITHYRPILAEKEEPRRHGRTLAHIPESQQSVFDRLKSAIAASESIPAIIAEIDALLPEGYCVAKRSTVNEAHIKGIGGVTLTSHPAEDMSDCRNWQVGDVLEAVEDFAFHLVRGQQYVLQEKSGAYIYVDSSVQKDVAFLPEKFRFHSRPAKVAE